jgi:hypothetical protein
MAILLACEAQKTRVTLETIFLSMETEHISQNALEDTKVSLSGSERFLARLASVSALMTKTQRKVT